MRPTVIAYRLLQPVKERRTSTRTSSGLRSATRAATLFAFCGRGDSPLARDEADGPRTTCFGQATPSPLFPVKAWRTRYETRTIHLDDALRRRLPVALRPWAEGPSEGCARLLMMRECPSSAPLVHPFVIGALGVRPGGFSRPIAATDRDPRITALPRRRTAL